MQIGCDPKADSTITLRHGQQLTTVLELVRSGNLSPKLEDMVLEGYGGVLCVEAGGPTPGLGCAGRGIIAALEKLEAAGAYDGLSGRMWCSTTCWGMWSAAALPCPCAAAMRTRCISSPPGRTWRFMRRRISRRQWSGFRAGAMQSWGDFLLNRRNVEAGGRKGGGTGGGLPQPDSLPSAPL